MKKQINRLIKNKTPFAFVIKILILIGVSYFLIQLSNKAKSIEEAQYIPDMQNALDYAEHYITWRYGGDWEELGHRMDIDGLCSLKMETGNRTLRMLRGGFSEFWLHLGFDRTWGEKGSGYRIWVQYGQEKPIEVTFSEDEDYISYQILCKDGQYVSNLEMEKYSGVTTDEILNLAEEMCASFESELQKMHEYQLKKIRKRRINLANFGLILLAIYMFYKWRFIMAEATEGDKPTEQYLGEAIVNTINKFARWKYVLWGATILFWIYILRPVISNFILFEVERDVNTYLSYGVSAIIVAIAGGIILTRIGAQKAENKLGLTALWKTIQMATGCILEMFIIRLGVMLVSNFYPCSLRFYIINGIAWIGTVFLMFVLGKVKTGMKIKSDYF